MENLSAPHRRRYDLDQIHGGGSALTETPAAELESSYPYHVCSAERSTASKVLQAVAYVMIIITCLAILMQMVRFEIALSELRQALEDMQSVFDGGLFGGSPL